ncbi:MAG: XrtA-associated tyrosine autokinase [Methylococcaceae bacterium]|nr:XrtA-associated tyrosine autokinase [Methylococcaceae bacterium]
MSIIEKALEKAQHKHADETSHVGVVEKLELPDAPSIASITEQLQDTHPSINAEGNLKPVSGEKSEKFHTIDWAALKSLGMLAPDIVRSQMVEEYRLIKRPLLMNAFPDGDNGIERSNLILVTSSVPGEGKTFSAVNLALSIAMERDKWVLLVDADVAKPSVSRVLGIKEQPGLIDLLTGKGLRLSDVIIRTDIPNLRILPAGTIHQHSTELLASDVMKRLAKELSERYPDRIVIFDSPPLLAATQAPVLAGLVGQVVLIVEADVTPQYIVQESLAKLADCKVVGCVLNKMKKGFGFTYYGLGYGYGYGYYGQPKNTD